MINATLNKAVLVSLTLLSATLLCATQLVAQTGAIDPALAAAIKADIRTDEERARDQSRKPLETLEFFGIEKDMSVLEIIPGGGWYTKILGTYLEDQGQLYLAVRVDPERLALAENGLEKVKITGTGYEFHRTDSPGFVADISEGDLGVSGLDMALTFRNVHNLTPAARHQLNSDVFDALKPGGIYGIIDHTKRHMAPQTAETWRRVDPVVIIHEALQAGFEFVGFSDVHYRDYDELIYDSRHETIQTDSDRFTLKFRKP